MIIIGFFNNCAQSSVIALVSQLNNVLNTYLWVGSGAGGLFLNFIGFALVP